MAFFRNYSNETVAQSVLDEKGQGQNINRVHSSVGNEYVDATSSEKDFESKVDGQYQSDGDTNDAGLQNEAAAADDIGLRISNLQPSGRRTAMAGKWGSTFWKDCQPMGHRNGSESEQDSKCRFDCKNEEALDDNSSDGREVDKVQKGQNDVPADEMSSDDYYEQDGEDQSDSLHYRGLNHSSVLNSQPQSRPVAVNMARNSKASNDNEYDDDEDGDNDGDADYEDEDEEEEDGNCI